MNYSFNLLTYQIIIKCYKWLIIGVYSSYQYMIYIWYRCISWRASHRRNSVYVWCSTLFFRWQFTCDGADIGFGVYKKKKMGEWMKASEMKEIVPNQRYNAHLVPEDGSLTCPEPGVCKYRFNRFYFISPIEMNIKRACGFTVFCLFRCTAIWQHIQHLPVQNGQLHSGGPPT